MPTPLPYENLNVPATVKTVAHRLGYFLRQRKLSTLEHNDKLIGREGTPEYKAWRARRLVLQIALGNAQLAAKQSFAKIAVSLKDGKVEWPVDGKNAKPEEKLWAILKLEYQLSDEELETSDLGAYKKVAIDACELNEAYDG